MAVEKLQIILDAAWRGKSAVQAANNDVNKLDTGVSKSQKALKGLAIAGGVAAAGIAAVGVAAKVAWDILGDGAALAKSRDEFERLTESIGSTADVMLGKLREATSGMVSDAELIAGAGQIMSLGLADGEDAVVRLAALVSGLGWDMQQVIMTFANDSVMRLDALGLAVEDVMAKKDALVAGGMSAGEAFDLAVIEAGEEKYRLLGDAADSAKGKMQKLETAFRNANDAFAESLAEQLYDELVTAADGADELGVAMIEMADKTAIAVAQAIADILALGVTVQGVIDQIQTGNWSPPGGTAPGLNDIFFGGDNPIDALWRGLTNGPNPLITTPAWMGQSAPFTANKPPTMYSPLADPMMNRSRRGETFPAPYQDLVANIGLMGGATEALDRLSMSEQSAWENAVLHGGAITGVTAALKFSNDENEELTGNLFGVGRAAESAADKMARLAAETGNFFDQARRGDDFDPAEAFYQSALSAGASAEQLRDLLIATGLESPERANEIFDESIIRQLAQLAGQQVPGGGNIDMLWGGVQAGVANPQWAQQVITDSNNMTNSNNSNSYNTTTNNYYAGPGGDGDLGQNVDDPVSQYEDRHGGG